MLIAHVNQYTLSLCTQKGKIGLRLFVMLATFIAKSVM